LPSTPSSTACLEGELSRAKELLSSSPLTASWFYPPQSYLSVYLSTPLGLALRYSINCYTSLLPLLGNDQSTTDAVFVGGVCAQDLLVMQSK
jgi:hypothetical protein